MMTAINDTSRQVINLYRRKLFLKQILILTQFTLLNLWKRKYILYHSVTRNV